MRNSLILGRSSSWKLSIAVLLVTMSDDPFSGVIRRTSLLFRGVFGITYGVGAEGVIEEVEDE